MKIARVGGIVWVFNNIFVRAIAKYKRHLGIY